MCEIIVTENRLDTGRKTHIIKAVKKSYMESGRKEREAIRLGPVSLLGGTQRMRGITWDCRSSLGSE